MPSATMATAMPSSAIDSIAGSTFGSTSRQMMRRFFAPCARAASTNSRSDHDNVLARVIRPSTGIDTIPSAMISATSGSRPGGRPAGGGRRGAQDGDQRQRQDHRRDREEHVEQARHDRVGPPAEVAREQPEHTADHEADEHGDGRDDERRAAAPEQAREHVAAVAVAAEQVSGRGTRLGERAAPGDVGDRGLAGRRVGGTARGSRRRPRRPASRATTTCRRRRRAPALRRLPPGPT